MMHFRGWQWLLQFPLPRPILEDYLNRVFGRQVNTFFDIIVYEEPGEDKPNDADEGIDFDFFPDGINDLRLGENQEEENAATPNPKAAAGPNPAANIDVWVVGGDMKLIYPGGRAFGYQFGGKGIGKILIDGSLFLDDRTEDKKRWKMLHTIAHEIGHVMAGLPHADEADCLALLRQENSGPEFSYTPHAKDKLRLMCSGGFSDQSNPGTQLIKKEWDLIEAWLKEEERLGRIQN